MANERMINIIRHKEIQIETTITGHYTLIKRTKIKKNYDNIYAGYDTEKLGCSNIAGGNAKW